MYRFCYKEPVHKSIKGADFAKKSSIWAVSNVHFRVRLQQNHWSNFVEAHRVKYLFNYPHLILSETIFEIGNCLSFMQKNHKWNTNYKDPMHPIHPIQWLLFSNVLKLSLYTYLSCICSHIFTHNHAKVTLHPIILSVVPVLPSFVA